MKNKFLLPAVVLAAFGIAGCSGSVSVNNATANKPANTTTANKPANTTATNSTTNSAAKTAPEPKTELKDEKAQKPAGESKKPATKTTVPENWIDMVDEVRGYGFQVPEGTKGDSTSEGGVDTFAAQTPDNIGIIVYAFKDATLTKDDLLERAEAAWKAMGETLTAGELKGEGDNYSLAEGTSVDADGKKSKVKVLVGTDVTDNYVMFVFTDEASYAQKEATMDNIWGSFEMYSGGATNN
jgi:outer membrane murein-binding lipoprotein Lpp